MRYAFFKKGYALCFFFNCIFRPLLVFLFFFSAASRPIFFLNVRIKNQNKTSLENLKKKKKERNVVKCEFLTLWRAGTRDKVGFSPFLA